MLGLDAYHLDDKPCQIAAAEGPELGEQGEIQAHTGGLRGMRDTQKGARILHAAQLLEGGGGKVEVGDGGGRAGLRQRRRVLDLGVQGGLQDAHIRGIAARR